MTHISVDRGYVPCVDASIPSFGIVRNDEVVTVCMREDTPDMIVDHVLSTLVDNLLHSSSPYHEISDLVNQALRTLVCQGSIRINRFTKEWVWLYD